MGRLQKCGKKACPAFAWFGETLQLRLIPLDPGQNAEIALDRPIILIGRNEECDVALESRKISRKHCIIAVLPDQLIIRDLGSTNGILVNGKKLTEARLLQGDELELGGVRFRLIQEPKTPPIHNPAMHENLKNNNGTLHSFVT